VRLRTDRRMVRKRTLLLESTAAPLSLRVPRNRWFCWLSLPAAP